MPKKIVLTWLPIRPTLYGLVVGVALYCFGMLLTLAFGWNLPSRDAVMFTFWFPVFACLVSYWAPIAYFVRKVSGTPFTLVCA